MTSVRRAVEVHAPIIELAIWSTARVFFCKLEHTARSTALATGGAECCRYGDGGAPRRWIRLGHSVRLLRGQPPTGENSLLQQIQSAVPLDFLLNNLITRYDVHTEDVTD